MPVEFIKGPIGSGKSRRLLLEFKKNLARFGAVFVLPCEGSASQFRRHMLLDDSCDVILGDAFISWSKFVHLIAKPTTPIFSKFQSELLLFKIISSEDLSYFKSKNPSHGVIEQFADTIHLLKENFIPPKELRSILDTRGGYKEADLLKVYEIYEERKKELNVIDESDIISLAVERILNDKVVISDNLNEIFIDEFHRFTFGQIKLIETIKDNLKDIKTYISFPTAASEDSLYSDYLDKGCRKIAGIANDTMKLKVSPTDAAHTKVKTARSPLQEMRAILAESALFVEDNKIKKDDFVIAVRNSSNELNEIISETNHLRTDSISNITSGALESPAVNLLLSPDSTDSWPEAGSVKTYTDLCRSFFKDNDRVDEWMNQLKSETNDRHDIGRSLLSASILEENLKQLEMASKLLQIESIRREVFIRLISDNLKPSTACHIAERGLPFRLLSFESGMAFSADNTIIPRMNEGNIPRSKSERLFFTDTDTLSPKPNEIIEQIFLTAEDVLAADAYLFDTFLLKTKKEILFTYPIIDDSGSETSRSALLDSMTGDGSFDGIELYPAVASYAGWDDKLALKVKIERDRSRGTLKFPEYNGILNSEKSKKLARERFANCQFSATSLERYAACPFTFFTEKVLGLKSKDEEMPELIPKDRGTILHEVLERFYSKYPNIAEKSNKQNKQETDLLEQIIDEVFEDNSDLISQIAPGLLKQQRALIRTMSLQEIGMEIEESASIPSPLTPFKCEWGFGEDGVPDLELPVKDDKPVKMHGWIDRIDVDKDKKQFLVVDYKTRSSATAVKNDILNGLKLQLPIYVEAVRRLLLPDSKPLGGLLIDVMSAQKRHGFVRKEFNSTHYEVGRSHSAMTDEVWDESINAAISACSAYVAAIRSGSFKVEPKKNCPPYCNYAEICRFTGKSSD